MFAFLASHCLCLHLIVINVQRSVLYFSFLPHPFFTTTPNYQAHEFPFIFVAFLITIIYRLIPRRFFFSHTHAWIMTLIRLYTFLLWWLQFYYTFYTFHETGNNKFNLNFHKYKKNCTYLTLVHAMIPALHKFNLQCPGVRSWRMQDSETLVICVHLVTGW